MFRLIVSVLVTALQTYLLRKLFCKLPLFMANSLSDSAKGALAATIDIPDIRTISKAGVKIKKLPPEFFGNKKVIAVIGPPRSGKSWISRKLLGLSKERIPSLAIVFTTSRQNVVTIDTPSILKPVNDPEGIPFLTEEFRVSFVTQLAEVVLLVFSSKITQRDQDLINNIRRWTEQRKKKLVLVLNQFTVPLKNFDKLKEEFKQEVYLNVQEVTQTSTKLNQFSYMFLNRHQEDKKDNKKKLQKLTHLLNEVYLDNSMFHTALSQTLARLYSKPTGVKESEEFIEIPPQDNGALKLPYPRSLH